MTDQIEAFTSWYQSLPQAAQIGIPIAGVAGVYLIAKHKSGLTGSQVFGPGSSQGGGTSVGPPNPNPTPNPQPNPNPVPITLPPSPINRPPTNGDLPPVGYPAPKPPGSTPGIKPISRPTKPVTIGIPEPVYTPPGGIRNQPKSSPQTRPHPYIYPTPMGRPVPGANHPVAISGMTNTYLVNGQDILHSGPYPKSSPVVVVGANPLPQATAKARASMSAAHVGASLGGSATTAKPAPVPIREQGAAVYEPGRGIVHRPIGNVQPSVRSATHVLAGKGYSISAPEHRTPARPAPARGNAYGQMIARYHAEQARKQVPTRGTSGVRLQGGRFAR